MSYMYGILQLPMVVEGAAVSVEVIVVGAAGELVGDRENRYR